MIEIEKEGENEQNEPTVVLSAAQKLGRRSFIQRLVMGAMGFAAALMSLPQKAEAVVQVACCVLCRSSTSCSGACCWTWGCCSASDHDRFWQCKECYSSSGACDGSCNGVVCSQAIRTQFVC